MASAYAACPSPRNDLPRRLRDADTPRPQAVVRVGKAGTAIRSLVEPTLPGPQAGASVNRTMSRLRATVRNRRLLVDVPTSLPEGTVLDLVVDDEGDELVAAEKAVLDEAIVRAVASAKAGDARDASLLVAELRNRR